MGCTAYVDFDHLPASTVASIRQRLGVLRQELRAGEAQLETLAQRRAALRDTLLRISGAIQVLDEMLYAEQTAPHLPTDVSDARPPHVANG